jgi:two-component system, NtrC family, C4-dicarboxylate transport response regulator DctD
MRRRFKIVVVDDERESLELAERALSRSRAPFDITLFPEAEAALEYLSATHVDLLVTDLRMPGMDGRALIRGFRAFDRTTPIVLASSEPIATEEALALGATAFVPKNSVNSQLASVVSDLVSDCSISLDARQAGDDAA